jgi:hypothetical protein
MSSTFDIYPSVNVIGTGTQSVNVVARAVINAVGNVVSSIEILESGLNYESATATVVAHSVVGARKATLRPVMSPEGGHGFDIISELGSPSLSLSVKFNGSESNTILTSNDYRTIGLVKDPMFANVNVQLSILNGIFLNGETVYKIDPITLGNRGSVNTTSNTFTSPSGNFETQFTVGSKIFLKDLLSNSHAIKTIGTIVNSTSLTFTTNGSFESANVQFSIPQETSYGTVINGNTTFLNIGSLVGEIETSDELIGEDSGAYAVANSIYRSGVAKGFDTFIGAHKYVGSVISGTFQEGETVYERSLSSSNAVLHSVMTGDETSFYAVDQFGTFTSNTSLFGATSNATASISAVYGPEVMYKSGDILYIENISPVTRTEEQSEQFKLIFRF